MHAAVNNLAQVVRWDIGCHTNGNTRAAIYKQVGQACGQQQRLVLAAVVVRPEVHGFLVNISE